MKEEALKLADELEDLMFSECDDAAAMIRRLVEELDKQTYKADLLENRLKFIVGSKPLSDEEIDKLIQDYKIGEFSGFYIDKAMTESMYARYNKVFSFVRAIEERHGIK